MDFRTRRQLVILLVVAIVLAGVGFFVLRPFLPAPSCTDGRRNQGEEEADCGGPCVPCAFRQQKPIEVFWVRFVKVRENAYDAAAEIKNPNVKIGAAAFAYEFKLLDTAGVAVATRRGETFLYPGETAHLVEVGLLSGRLIQGAALAIGEVAWALSDAPGPDIVAGSKEYVLEGDPAHPVSVMKAIVSNRGLRDLSGIGVSALAFDADGNLLGAHRSVVESLPAGSAEPVKFTWPVAFATAPSSLVVEARSPSALPLPRP